jgi:hypothetical protein
MQSGVAPDDIVVTYCLTDCMQCTGLYINEVLNSKIVCECECHGNKGQPLEEFAASLLALSRHERHHKGDRPKR